MNNPFIPPELRSLLLSYHQGCPGDLPQLSEVENFTAELLGLLFPQLSEGPISTAEALDSQLDGNVARLEQILTKLERRFETPTWNKDHVIREFYRELTSIHERLRLDAQALWEGDPAARSINEVILAYPGFFAVSVYRIAHALLTLGVPIIPRMLTELAHQTTGVDIHPGATIGSSFFIDHGTGVVIGETAVIGDHVKIYQGVALGALSVDKSFSSQKRHPTIEDHVVIYANATILGGETIIGHHSTIGGNVWLTESIPPYTTVYHKGEVKLRTKTETTE